MAKKRPILAVFLALVGLLMLVHGFATERTISPVRTVLAIGFIAAAAFFYTRKE